MDMIYDAVFCEKSIEYKKLLDLSEKDNLRRTLYAEVLVAVSSFENGVADEIEKKSQRNGKLEVSEVQDIVTKFAAMPFGKPIVDNRIRYLHYV